MSWTGHGGTALSVLLHLTVGGMLLVEAAPPRPMEEAPPIMVELVREQPPSPIFATNPPNQAAAVAEAPPPPSHSVIRSAPPRPQPRKSSSQAAPTVAAEAPAAPVEASPPQALAAAPEAARPAEPVRMAGSAEYGAYVGRLHDRIAQRRVYPPQSIRRREEGDVRLRVLVATDGHLLHIHNLAGSSALLTQAARNAVENAAPFEPPPLAAPTDQQIAFDVTIVFRLD